MAGSTDWAGTSEKRRALQTELCLGRVLRLAPGTLHTGASQRAGAGTGRTGGASLVWRAGGVKDAKERPGPLRARLHLSLRGCENWVLWLKRFPRGVIEPIFGRWGVGDFQNRPASTVATVSVGAKGQCRFFRRSDSSRSAGRDRLGHIAPSGRCGCPARAGREVALPAGSAGRACRMTDSGTRLPAGGSATWIREEHRTENPASTLPDEPVSHALAFPGVHGCHRDCHHRGSAGAGRESGFWFLSMKSSPRTRPTRIFLGVGVGPRRKRGPIDLRNVEALRAIQPHGRGDQRSRRPGSKQLIHHQVLTAARAHTTPTYPRSPCPCVILECCARTIAQAPPAGSARSGRGGALACLRPRGPSAARCVGILEGARLLAPR